MNVKLKNELMTVKESRFTPEVYYVDGDYIVKKLQYNGTTTSPYYFKVKEADLEKIYGINEEGKNNIPRYAGFTLVPENDKTLYKSTIDLGDGLGNLNLYIVPEHSEGKHEVSEDNQCNWPHISGLINHIATSTKPYPNSRYTYTQLLLDYMAIAWRVPCQGLPILALVSKERSTGKTTFLQLLDLIFQNNAKMVTVRDLANPFNMTWGLANLILVDEAKIPKSMMTMIRNESTSRTRTINQKYLPSFDVPNHSKFVMASNEIEKFADIDTEENRYFVIEIKSFPKGAEVPKYLELMLEELPHFIDYLTNHHQIQTKCETRMWFNYFDYRTPALEKITKSSKSAVYFKVEEALEFLNTINIEYSDEQHWEFSLTNFRNHLQLDKGKETEIKDALSKLGVQCDERKARFKCAFTGRQTNAIRYSISVGALRIIFDFNETAIHMAEKEKINAV
jgi:hypothetical protein